MDGSQGGSVADGGGSTLARLRSLCPTVSVGILPADLMSLGSELALLERAGVGIVHIDVMDGCFCPWMTVGAPYVKGLRTPLLKDVHLMVHEPLDKLPAFVAAGADIITVHVEAAVHIHRVLQRLGGMEHSAGPGRGIVRGLALNPGTPLEWLTSPLLQEAEMISLLAVDPGWSGQRFAPHTLERVVRVKQIIAESGKDILVGVDGGITRDNIAEVAAAGPDLISAGSAVFDGKGDAEAKARFVLEAVRAHHGGS
ncbi:MAG: ribulose-phosphate 3-epimerase [Thermoleophilia bacterium]|nr:ribulose-phosphate 3-epimerase [Thermoleophilia bacterium]